MNSSRPLLKTCRRFAAFGILLLVGGTEQQLALAEGDSCDAHYVATQKLERAGRLIEARVEATKCSQTNCASYQITHCTEWLTRIKDAVPSILVVATSGNDDIVGAQVFIDDKLVTERLSGSEIELDPGDHSVRVQHNGQSSDKSIVVRVGEKRRVIKLELPTSPQPPPTVSSGVLVPATPGTPKEHRPSLGFALTVTTVGVTAFTIGAVLGVTGRSDLNDLKQRCKGLCEADSAEERDIRTRLIAADISMLAGGLITGVGSLLVWRSVTYKASVQTTGTSWSIQGVF